MNDTIERMAEAIDDAEHFQRPSMQAQAALQALVQPIANYTPDMGAVLRFSDNGLPFLATQKTEHGYEIADGWWRHFGSDVLVPEKKLTPYFIDLRDFKELMK